MSEAKSEAAGTCGDCPGKICYPLSKSDAPLPDKEKAPSFCPMRRFPGVLEKVKEQYGRSDIREFARLASIQEAECYERTPEGMRTKIPRIEEIMQLAQKCGYRRIGFAFCTGLREEFRMVSDILEAKGFEVVGVNCKVGGVPKEFIGIEEEQKIAPPGIMETMCNPIAQAEVLNAEEVDLAVVLGLCVGHDTLFFKYVQVPCTVLAVKDRVTGHNPLQAVYLSKGPYYGRVRGKADLPESAEVVTLPENPRD
jgi:uncharacterized metal-binding protein